MNKKFKKILATCCLGVVGCLGLAGCSLTSNQQEALDRVVESADNLTSSLEDYFALHNSSLNKEAVEEKLNIINLDFQMEAYDQVHMTYKRQLYEGVFDVANGSQSIDIYIQNKDNVRKSYINEKDIASDSGEEIIIEEVYKSDFNENVFYTWSLKDGLTNHPDYVKSKWEISDIDIFETYQNITAEDIYDIKSEDRVISFRLIKRLYGKDNNFITYQNMYVELKNNKITTIDADFIYITFEDGAVLMSEDGPMLDKYGMPIVSDKTKASYSSEKLIVTYEYEDADFSIVDNKILEIENNENE